MGDKKRSIFAWATYDLANTAYSALFVTFFFPLFIKVYLGGNEFQIGLVMGISMFLAGVLVPYLGAISDITQRRMPFIIFFTIVTVIFASLVPFVGLYPALILALLANLTYHAALDVYDTKLIDISTKKNIGMISGYGISLGYVGTILSLVMAYFILNYFGWETKVGAQAMFPATGLFFLVFSLITFFILKDKVKKLTISTADLLKKAFLQLKGTIKNMPKQKGLIPFLLASFLYSDGAHTAIIFLYLYGREQIGLSVQTFFYLYAIMALAAAVGSLIFGKVTDKIGPKKSLIIMLIMWIGVVITLMNVSTLNTFLIAGSFGGVALGALWTSTRPMLVELSPKKNIAELFGFQGLTEKFSGVIGPILFGYVVIKAGYQPALIILLAFFVLALLIFKIIPSKNQ